MSFGKILISGAKLLMVAKIISFIGGIAIQLIIVRNSSLATYGEYATLYGLSMLFATLSTSYAISNITRFVPEILTKNSGSSLLKVLIVWLIGAIALNIVTICIMLYFANDYKILGPLLDDHVLAVYIWFYFSLILYIFSSNVLLSIAKYNDFTRATIASNSIALIYLVYLVVTRVEIKLEDIFTVTAISQSVAALLTLLVGVRGALHGSGSSAIDRRRSRNYGIKSMINETLSASIGKNVEIILASAVAGPIGASVISVVQKYAQYLGSIMPTKEITNAARPLLIAKSVQNGNENVNTDISRISLLVFMVYAVMASLLVPYTYELVSAAFGKQYAEYATIFSLVPLLLLAQALHYQVGLKCVISEKIEYAIYSKIFAIPLIFASYMMSKSYGISIIIIFSLVIELTKGVLLYYMMKQGGLISINYRPYMIILATLVLPSYVVFCIEIEHYNYVIIAIPIFVAPILIYKMRDYDSDIKQLIKDIKRVVYHFLPSTGRR